MTDPNWTGPFTAMGPWINDGDRVSVARAHGPGMEAARAAAIAHALNRLPEAEARIVELEGHILTVLQRETGNIERADAKMEKAEAEIERLRVALALFIGPYEAELAEKKSKFDRYTATPWCAARIRITEQAFVDGLAALKGQTHD
jgi:hypothetical protein